MLRAAGEGRARNTALGSAQEPVSRALVTVANGTEHCHGDRQKRELVDFLVKKAFNPVLHAKADGRSEADKRKLEHVRDATQAEIERYRDYGSAEEVVTNFRADLHSTVAKKVHAELKSLHLPTLDNIRDEFEDKARELGVEGRS